MIAAKKIGLIDEEIRANKENKAKEQKKDLERIDIEQAKKDAKVKAKAIKHA